jgi:hypothetical protein
MAHSTAVWSTGNDGPLILLGRSGSLLGGARLVSRLGFVCSLEPVKAVDVLSDTLLALHVVHLLQHNCPHIKELVSHGGVVAESSDLVLGIPPAGIVNDSQAVGEHSEQVLV